MKNIAIIPARGGSKRIPRKNIKHFLGKPIIAYSIEAALSSKLFDEVMVSTDDEEIAEIAMKYGAKVPFLRTKENSNDFATTADVIIEVLNTYVSTGVSFDNICCIYPTAPLISIDSLNDSFSILVDNEFDSVFPVVEYSYPIQRSLGVNQGKIEMVWPENLNKRSQDLESRYHDAGQFYWLKFESFLKTKLIYSDNAGFFKVDELLVQDIDDETDWKLAELKFSLTRK